ncbi:unnamed protein product [Brassica oleracea]
MLKICSSYHSGFDTCLGLLKMVIFFLCVLLVGWAFLDLAFFRGLWPKIVLYSLGRLIGIFYIYFVPLELVFFSQYHYH